MPKKTAKPPTKPKVFRFEKGGDNFTPEERMRLRTLFADPLVRRAFEYAEQEFKPTVFISPPGGVGSVVNNPETAAAAANNRLHEIRGWEMYEAALMQTIAPRPKMKQAPQDNFPDEGRIDE